MKQMIPEQFLYANRRVGLRLDSSFQKNFTRFLHLIPLSGYMFFSLGRRCFHFVKDIRCERDDIFVSCKWSDKNQTCLSNRWIFGFSRLDEKSNPPRNKTISNSHHDKSNQLSIIVELDVM
jgi:hypothetical protein